MLKTRLKFLKTRRKYFYLIVYTKLEIMEIESKRDKPKKYEVIPPIFI